MQLTSKNSNAIWLTLALSLTASSVFAQIDMSRTDAAQRRRYANVDVTKLDGYTCCNLRYRDDWITDAGWAEWGFIPAGTPVKAKSFEWNKVIVEIDGKRMRLGNEYSRSMDMVNFTRKYIIKTNPKNKIASYSQDVQAAINAGQVMKGMSKEQVIIALGYPMLSENPTLSAPTWRYWVGSFDEYQVQWGDDGLVQGIAGLPPSLARVVYKPK